MVDLLERKKELTDRNKYIASLNLKTVARCQYFSTTYIVKSLEKPITRPNLVKDSVCPSARSTKLIDNLIGNE
jgi:hypothetical protein